MSATRAPAIRGARHHAPAWLITGLATAASTYALEAVATTTGVALAASGLFDGFGRPLLLGVLVATYVAWAAGMRANLAANWSLLESTATSTNLLAKAAHALARASGARPRTRRRATSTAYVLTELAKELPYYAGAFGAELASEAVSTDDALVFLAGTNLGAALYEYGIARATRKFLSARHC